MKQFSQINAHDKDQERFAGGAECPFSALFLHPASLPTTPSSVLSPPQTHTESRSSSACTSPPCLRTHSPADTSPPTRTLPAALLISSCSAARPLLSSQEARTFRSLNVLPMFL
ncbi:hypothetical protein BB559_007144 [Furculomyces boomerangus]|uniref:Uncharacterized protein n=2 Tax=Harpellales TaxID=61421 RepID=A0A2T9XYP3_9FUNG|nr:hypothetical protein BB559_007144 [Furculomyces boomerangus]PWA02633.1 hypothetical protein BB558_001230 [Smittium angustum]